MQTNIKMFVNKQHLFPITNKLIVKKELMNRYGGKSRILKTLSFIPCTLVSKYVGTGTYLECYTFIKMFIMFRPRQYFKVGSTMR